MARPWRITMRRPRQRLHLLLAMLLALNIVLLVWPSSKIPPDSKAVSPMATSLEADPNRCVDYSTYAGLAHDPATGGKYNLPYQRPRPECRKASIPEVEDAIESMRDVVVDPDLFRLFENCFPNTLDTAITWTGLAENSTDEELTFITTGDIPAMWLRDSANQLRSYISLLRPDSSPSSLAALFRGAINLQARYIRAAPHCNAFAAPREAAAALGIRAGSAAANPSGGASDRVFPPFAPNVVWECKYELDSLAAFLQLSWDYFSGTGDAAFFSRGSRWAAAVARVLDVAEELGAGTYAPDGRVRPSPYRSSRQTSQGSETLGNGGSGSPVRGGTGLVRSAFRPSDDACTYQLLVPANMMLARHLAGCAEIADRVAGEAALAGRMRAMAGRVRAGVERYGRARHPEFGEVYAYEVDGFGSTNLMDDANLPSLLGAPLTGYLDRDDGVYRNTRRLALSRENPYFMWGPVINGTGGPHLGPGMAWPMSLIVQIMTSDDDGEIAAALRQLLGSTGGRGLMHESVHTHSAGIWTRQWFSWANGLFGQMLLDLRDRKPHLLATSFQ